VAPESGAESDVQRREEEHSRRVPGGLRDQSWARSPSDLPISAVADPRPRPMTRRGVTCLLRTARNCSRARTHAPEGWRTSPNLARTPLSRLLTTSAQARSDQQLPAALEFQHATRLRSTELRVCFVEAQKVPPRRVPLTLEGDARRLLHDTAQITRAGRTASEFSNPPNA